MVTAPPPDAMARMRPYMMPALIVGAALGGYWWYTNRQHKIEYERSIKGRSAHIADAVKDSLTPDRK